MSSITPPADRPDAREALVAAILENATDYAILSTDLEGRVTLWNPGARDLFGWSEAEMLGQPFARLFVPRDQAEERPRQDMYLALERGRAAAERWHVRKDGTWFWAVGELMPLRDGHGEAIGFINMLRDRTEQRLAFEQARDNAEFLQRLLEGGKDVLQVLDLQGRPQVDGTELAQALRGAAEGAELREALEKARGGGIGRFQRRVEGDGDGPRWWDVQITPIPGADGQPERLLCICRDITHAQRSASELQASEARFRAAVRAVDGVMWTSDAQGAMTGEQPGWRSLTGQTREQYEGFGWADALHPDDREAAFARWRHCLAERIPFVSENRVHCQDGRYRLFSVRAIPALYPDGSLREWVGVHTDISAYRAVQDSLRRETERLEILNRSGARLAAELDLDRLVQEATEAGVAISGAQFGAFFYNVVDEAGESYTLYALSGVPREAFADFPMPRNTEVFRPTFHGEGVIRSDDITRDPRYGRNAPNRGMPAGHLPVRSYLALPVVSRNGSVLGGLLFGHARPGLFNEDHEHLLSGIAAQAAIAIDNAQLYRASRHEIAERKRAEELARQRTARLELLSEAIEKAPSATTPVELMEIVAEAARRLAEADGVAFVLRQGEHCFYASETARPPLWTGQRFAIHRCVSGWAMLNRRTAVVSDVLDDPRTDRELYRGTHIRSLVMVPLVSDGESSAAIGAYWSHHHTADDNEVAVLEALARTAGAVLKRLEAEQALRTLNENLEAQVAARTADCERMWRLSTDVMVVARFDGTITAVNPAWNRLFGLREEELIGHSLFDRVHPEDEADTRRAVRELAGEAAAQRFEHRYRGRDGLYRWLSWVAVPDAGLLHAVGRDVTPRKEQEEALRQAEEALRQAQKMEAVGQLTGGIAHDFNNLLTGIVGALDMIAARIAQGRLDAVQRYHEAAMASANRAAALTHRLLAFARRQPLAPKTVDVNRLVTSMEDLLRRTLGEDVWMEFVIADDLWPTRCDPNQLESAILNLAINARDAMPDGGTLALHTSNVRLDAVYAASAGNVKPGEYVCLAVIDTGTGMPASVIERAFDPFFTTKPIGQGTGLGLSMIYGFAQQSEGHVRIYSEEGQGTTIKLYLPRQDEGEATADEAAPRAVQAAGGGETVLVVEDEALVRGLVVDVLAELGYRTLEAADGPSGLAILQGREPIDLLVTDIGLPGLNGRQVAERGRQLRPALKVLFITGYAETATLPGGFLESGMQLLTKPFAVDALAERIQAMLE